MSGTPKKARVRTDADRERDRARRARQKASEDQAGPGAETGSAETGSAGSAGPDAGPENGSASGNATEIIPGAVVRVLGEGETPDNLPFGDDLDDGDNAMPGDPAPGDVQPAPKRRGRPPGKGTVATTKRPTPGRASASGASSRTDVRERATQLTRGIFGAVAMVKGEHWQITNAEAELIGKEIESFTRALPGNAGAQIEKMVSSIAAPFALIAAVSAPVMARVVMEQRYLAQIRREEELKANVQRTNGFTGNQEDFREGRIDTPEVAGNSGGDQSGNGSIFGDDRANASRRGDYL